MASKAQLRKLGIGRGNVARPPEVLTQPQIVSDLPGIYRVGVQITATPPTFTETYVTVSGEWYVNGAATGDTDATYTPLAADEADTLYKRFVGTDPFTGLTTTVDTPVVGPVEAAAATPAPAVADQTLNFGRLTRAGAGGAEPANTGGDITSAAITGGTNANHWQISALGVITPSSTGVTAGLSASYSLTCSFTNDFGSDTATITINTEADAYDVASAAEMTAACTHMGTASVPKKIYVREGAQLAWVTTWFNSRNHSALVTIEARTRRTATFTGLGYPSNTRFSNPNNLWFEGMVFEAKYYRRQQRPSGVILWEGTIGSVTFSDCDLDGNLSDMAPGFSYWGWVNVSAATATNMDNAHIRFLNCDLHGVERIFLANNTRANVSPGPKIEMSGCDVWDFGNDGPTLAGYWNQVRYTNNRIHSPYVDINRVLFFGKADYVWKRATAWDGASNGKKLLFNVHCDFQYNTSTQTRTIYAEGGATTPTLEVYRVGGAIHVTVRDVNGNILMDAETTATIGVAGTEQMNLLVDIDTDRVSEGIKVHLWREKDLGGGEWVEKLTAETNGELLNLTAGSISMSGRFDGTQSGAGNTSYIFFKRIALWYGQALSTDSDRNIFVNDTTGFVGPWATIQTAYGNPIMYEEGRAADWKDLGNMGTGGQWSTHVPGAAETGHVDGAQTLFNSTITDLQVSDLVIAAFKDTSAKYARVADPGNTVEYDQLQGWFGEDIKTGNVVDGGSWTNCLACVASGHAWSFYNLKDCTVSSVSAFLLERWNRPTTNYPRVRLMLDGVTPTAGGNTVTNCWAYQISSSYPVGSDTITGSVTDQALIPTSEPIDTVDELITYAVNLGAVSAFP